MRVHFIGIGGSGMSALAWLHLSRGDAVSGSDMAFSPMVEDLRRSGVKIAIGQQADNLPAAVNSVIYSIAVAGDNPELVEARRRGIAVRSYPEALGEISRDRFTVAVAGTHGKTTTTAMLAEVMIAAGLEPTVIVGSLLTLPDGRRRNFIPGRGRYFLVEACEYRRSFLNLWPRLLVITNIDNDHLDYYRDLADIRSAFDALTAKLPPDGKLITEREYRKTDSSGLKLLVPGEHNVLNAKAALAAAAALGVAHETALGALNRFRGVWRRLEWRGETVAGAKVYDDYGHHPTAIKATLGALRSLVAGKIFVVFQPHLYSRTRLLFEEFARSFALADEVFLPPVYAAREPVDPSVGLGQLAKAIQQESGCRAAAVDRPEAVIPLLRVAAKVGDAILTLGAGDIYLLGDRLLTK